MAFEISSIFLNPIGLLGLLGLVPLIVFYLMKPEPEERIMPSMAFFMSKEKSGKMEQALSKLMKNLLLLFHILMIIGFTAALAQLYFMGESRPDSAVIILDRSASMQNDLKEAKTFANSNLGETNTVLIAGQNTAVAGEEVSAGKARSLISNAEPRDVETDIASAIELATSYEGQMVLASDLDQTVNERPIEDLVNSISARRNIKVFDTEPENSWGIVKVNPREGNSSIEIANFRQDRSEIDVTINGDKRTVSVPGGSTEQVSFSNSPLTRIEIEDDDLKVDNKAFISSPSDEKYTVDLVADDRNNYLMKAFELMENVEATYHRPPVKENLDGDLIVIGKSSRILETTIRDLENKVNIGKTMVVFGQDAVFEKDFESVKTSRTGQRAEAKVDFNKPFRANVGSTEIFPLKGTGSLSEPGDALRKFQYGEGTTYLYNIRDEDFRSDFLYPVFWKKIVETTSDSESVSQLNIKTGQVIEAEKTVKPDGETEEGAVKAYQQGFYNASGKTYAANLESRDESLSEPVEITGTETSSSKTEKNLQKIGAVILALLVLLELLYLRYLGDL